MKEPIVKTKQDYIDYINEFIEHAIIAEAGLNPTIEQLERAKIYLTERFIGEITTSFSNYSKSRDPETILWR